MATTKFVVYLVTVLVPLALVLSENAPSLPSLPGVPGVPGLSASGASGQSGEKDHQERLFFSLFPRVTACNYTSEPGRTCRSCTQALTCLSSNVGLLRNCRGVLRYCNNGRCSATQGSACDAITTTSTEATTTA